MIKKATDANITVGQNGVIWLAAEDPKSELIAAQAIQKIESESHTSGLTETIKSFLEKVTGRTVQVE
jgi:exosome complex component RRP4